MEVTQYDIPRMMEQANWKNKEQQLILTMRLDTLNLALRLKYINEQEWIDLSDKAYEFYKPKTWKQWLDIQNNKNKIAA